MRQLSRPRRPRGAPARPTRRRRRSEAGLEMIQVALYAVAAIVLVGILIGAISFFVRSETNQIQPVPAGGGIVIGVVIPGQLPV